MFAGKIFKVEDGYLINEIVAPEKLHMLAYLDQNMTNIVSLKETTLESIQERTLFYYLSLDPEPYTICEETCRPKYMVDGEPFYNKLLKDLFKFKVNKNMIEAVQIKSMEDLEFPEMLSMCKIFISFVVANKEYPTLAEYKEFLLKNKKSYHATKEVKKLCIFPSVIIRDLKKIHDYYEPITKKMSPKIFIERARNSFFVEDKVKIENSIFSVLK